MDCGVDLYVCVCRCVGVRGVAVQFVGGWVMITYIPVVEEARERTRRAREAIIKGEDCMLAAAALLISRSLLLCVRLECVCGCVCVCGWKEAGRSNSNNNNNHKQAHDERIPSSEYASSTGREGGGGKGQARLLKINVPRVWCPCGNDSIERKMRRPKGESHQTHIKHDHK